MPIPHITMPAMAHFIPPRNTMGAKNIAMSKAMMSAFVPTLSNTLPKIKAAIPSLAIANAYSKGITSSGIELALLK